MSCGVVHRSGSDPMLLWLWHSLAAVVLTGPLAWEPTYAIGVALESKKKKKKNIVRINRNCENKCMTQSSVLG